MLISLFDLFSIGIGPSSSHTVGPMRAAKQFASTMAEKGLLAATRQVKVDLFGSLALTGKGHGTHGAVLVGLEGELPESVVPESLPIRLKAIQNGSGIKLHGYHHLPFDFQNDLIIHLQGQLPFHSNGLRFTAFNAEQELLFTEVYYSVGGGFIVNEKDIGSNEQHATGTVPYPFSTAQQLLKFCEHAKGSIADVMLANELALRSEADIRLRLLLIAEIMQGCIARGCHTDGILPGGLNIKRRAAGLFRKLEDAGKLKSTRHEDVLNCLNLFAIAVNEENAAGGRVVTAPTNGAAGIIPSVMAYFKTCYPEKATDDAIITYLLTAGAIAILYKKGASISGAEVGCQGEVGVASSMAAGALTAVLGGTIYQVENAAEIAMEHHLGMTCDPIGGLVQIPCIERNAMGSVKAVNAALLALSGDGKHFVSLDKVIAVMRHTGKDMMSIYKETSLGGLAVNHPEC